MGAALPMDGTSGDTLAIAHDTGATTHDEGAYLGVKRAFDVVVAAVLLCVLSPLLVVSAVLIKLDSRGPVFFRQERMGQGMRRFRVWKFRSMRTDADPEVHRRYIEQLVKGDVPDQGLKKLVDDPRVTRVGRVLRRSSIDELPQLFN